jgi:hypothetical protein
MTFEETLDQAFAEPQPLCPKCNTSIIVVPGEPQSCNCGWTSQAGPDCETNLQFGQRYSELARMVPKQSMPGINAGQGGDR